MEFQFLDHDYYFLDTFYIPIVLAFTLLIIKLPLFNTLITKSCFGALILLFGVVTFTYAKNTLTTDKDFFNSLVTSTANDLKGADTILDSLAIPTDAKLLVISSDGPNNSLLRLHRKGFVVIYPDSEKIKLALTWPYNYIVIENSRLTNDVIKNY